MFTKNVIAHFGSQAKVASALGIKQQSVADWGEEVPKLRQLQIQVITRGKLRADPQILRKPQPMAGGVARTR